MPVGGRSTGIDIDRLRRDDDLQGLRAAAQYRRMRPDANGNLVDASVQTRIGAIAGLTLFDGPEVHDALVASVGDREEPVRRAGLVALADRDTPAALSAVVDAALCADYADAQATAAELLTVRDGAARVAVERYLDPEARVNEAAVQAVCRIVAVRDDAERLQLLDMVATQLADASVQGRAADLLAAFAPESRIALQAALRDPDRQIAAARAFGLARDAGGTPALVALLGSGSAEHQVAAARALAQIQDPRAAAALMRARSDGGDDVRAAASAALAALGPITALAFARAAGSELLPADLDAFFGDLSDSAVEPARPAPAPAPPKTRPRPKPAPVTAPAPRKEGMVPVVAPAREEPVARRSRPPLRVNRRRIAVGVLGALVVAGVIAAALTSFDDSDDTPAAREVSRTAPTAAPDADADADAVRRRAEAARRQRAARLQAKKSAGASAETHEKLVLASRKTEARRKAAAAQRRGAAQVRAATTTPAPTPSAPRPTVTARPAPSLPTAAPTAAPPAPAPDPQRTAAPAPTPQVTQPDPVP